MSLVLRRNLPNCAVVAEPRFSRAYSESQGGYWTSEPTTFRPSHIDPIVLDQSAILTRIIFQLVHNQPGHGYDRD